MKVYIASSWRNKGQPAVVRAIRAAGHEVYDFRNLEPGNSGFHWSEIDCDWETWTKERYRKCLSNPIAVKGFRLDVKAMEWADAFVGVQPFGRSASIEMGWAVGKGKLTVLILENGEPELMVKMFDHICCSMSEVLACLSREKGD